MGVPYTFGTATTSIPLSNLDANFNTPVTIGSTTVGLGNTVTTVANLTLTNATISSGNVTVTTGIFGAGSNTAPSITTTGDTNTGIFFPAADTIAFTEGGTESMRIDASGSVGVGVTPSAWATLLPVQVKNGYIAGLNNRVYVGANNYYDGTNSRYIATDFATRYYQNAGQHIWETAASGTAGNAITFTQAMTLDASGNVGIGTSSPSARLHVSTSAAGIAEPVWLNNSQAVGANVGSRLVFTGTTSNNGLAAIDGAFAGATTADGGYMVFNTRAVTSGTLTERMRIDSSGNVGIGTSSPDGKLKVVASGANLIIGFSGTQNYFDASENIFRNFAGTERMRITSGGSVCVNTTAAVVDSTSRLIVSTTTTNGVAGEFSNSTSGTCALAVNNSGAATSTLINWIAAGSYRAAVTWNGTNIIYGTPSDQRLKENIVDSTSALPLINNIKIRSFDFKENGKHIDFGVIAQELVSVVPESVLKGKDNEDGSIKESWSVDTSTLVPAMIKAIQELKAELDSVKAELQTLKGN